MPFIFCIVIYTFSADASFSFNALIVILSDGKIKKIFNITTATTEINPTIGAYKNFFLSVLNIKKQMQVNIKNKTL